MSDYGGIFDSNSVLGIPTSLGEDDADCVLSQWLETDLARKLQQLLVGKGVQGLSVDGIWGPCSESAYKSVFGVGTSTETLKTFAGVSCPTLKKYLQGNCSSPPTYASKPSAFLSQLTVQNTAAVPTITTKSASPFDFLSMFKAPQPAPSPFQSTKIAATPQQMPPYTTQAIIADTGGGGGAPSPYVPPASGQQIQPGFEQPGQPGQSSPWLKYGLVAGVVVAAGLGLWWWAGRKPEQTPASPPSGRLRPVGTIE